MWLVFAIPCSGCGAFGERALPEGGGMGKTVLAWLVALAVLVAGGMDAKALSWYEVAGELAGSGVETDDGAVTGADDGERMRETVEAVVAQYDQIGAGELARQCLDASRIVQIAEHPTGWRELLFLVAGLVSLTAALFITKLLADMFKVEVAKLLWIPIALCVALLGMVFYAVHRARKQKVALAAGVALSAAGVVSVVDPVRHAFFGAVAETFLWFTAWYVPIVAVIVGMAGVLLVASLLFKHLGAEWFGPFVLRNTVGLVAIPAVCAVVFLAILSVVGPWFDAHVGTFAGEVGDGAAPAGVPFGTLPKKVRVAAAEMARAAEGVYGGVLPAGATPAGDFLESARQGGVKGNWNPSTGVLETASGLAVQVYRRRTGWGKKETVVMFRGTAGAKDGLEDWQQLFGEGEAQQYAEAAEVLRAVRESEEGPVVVAGHSLGGGQAQYALAMNAGRSGIRGVGFNTAGLSGPSLGGIEQRMGGGAVAAAGAFATVRLADDPVSTAGIFLGRVILVPSNGARGLAAHSITTLAREMERNAA